MERRGLDVGDEMVLNCTLSGIKGILKLGLFEDRSIGT